MGAFLRYFAGFIGSVEIFAVVASILRLIVNGQEIATYYDELTNEKFSKVILPVIIIINLKLLIAACLLVKGVVEQKPRFFIYWLVNTGVISGIFTICSLLIFFALLFFKSNYDVYYEYSMALFVTLFVTGILWAKWTVVFQYYRYLKKNPVNEIHSYSQFKNCDIPSDV